MADTGWVLPGTGANRPISANKDWTNPDRVTADDSARANVFDDSPAFSDGLAASNFDFSAILSGATIDGIEIEVEVYNSSGAGVEWALLKLILSDDSDGTEDKKAVMTTPWPGIPTTEQAGGASDLWSETIASSDVKDIDWGFSLQVEFVTASPNALVDSMKMKVYYTPPIPQILATGHLQQVIRF